MSQLIFNEDSMKRLLTTLLKGYRFQSKNKNPDKIVIEIFKDIDGIPIEYKTNSSSIQVTGKPIAMTTNIIPDMEAGQHPSLGTEPLHSDTIPAPKEVKHGKANTRKG